MVIDKIAHLGNNGSRKDVKIMKKKTKEQKAALKAAADKFASANKKYGFTLPNETAKAFEHRLIDLDMKVSNWAQKKAEEEISK